MTLFLQAQGTQGREVPIGQGRTAHLHQSMTLGPPSSQKIARQHLPGHD